MIENKDLTLYFNTKIHRFNLNANDPVPDINGWEIIAHPVGEHRATRFIIMLNQRFNYNLPELSIITQLWHEYGN
jgi:hypothetical protein